LGHAAVRGDDRRCGLGDGVRLLPYCVLIEAVVEDNATLGPFCL
jgi:hypothetical protein